jgi:DsbE subfamily thiol:disulfide oxidoreductase
MKTTLSAITIVCLALLAGACGQQPKVAAVGQPAPDFTLVDRKGRTWHLAELKGQVVFVNFWASWCPPCRQEMPSMQALYASMPSDKFKMLAILYKDKPEAADTLTAQLGCTFPVLVDPGNKTGQAYGLTGVPETYIVDKEGVLREKYIGPVQWNSLGARQMIMKYISQ